MICFERRLISSCTRRLCIYTYWILCIYLQFVPGIISNGIFQGIISDFIYQMSYYLFLQRLYMGSGARQPGPPLDELNHDTRFVDRRPKYMHWSGSLRHFTHLALSEFRSLFCGGSNCDNGKNSSSVGDSAASFNHLMNIALKSCTYTARFTHRSSNTAEGSTSYGSIHMHIRRFIDLHCHQYVFFLYGTITL